MGSDSLLKFEYVHNNAGFISYDQEFIQVQT